MYCLSADVILGNVVLRVLTCNRDGENDMDSCLTRNLIILLFFLPVFNCMGISVCHSFVCPVNGLQRPFTINTLPYI